MPTECSHPSIFKRLPVILRNSVKKEFQHLCKNRISFKKLQTETSQEEAEHTQNEQFNFSPFTLFCISLHKKTLQGFAMEGTCFPKSQSNLVWKTENLTNAEYLNENIANFTVFEDVQLLKGYQNEKIEILK